MQEKEFTVKSLIKGVAILNDRTILSASRFPTSAKIFVDLSKHLPTIDHSDIPMWNPSDTREELIETIDELSRMYSEVVDKIESLSEDPAVSGIGYHSKTNTVGIKITDK